MKQVNLTRIELAQFRSFVKPTVIDLTSTSGLKLVSGDNELEPSLGANGAGKSTIWDSLCWCISERSIKGLRTSDLISYGKDRTEVATVWQINDETVRLHRTGPPNRIRINDRQAEQQEVDRLLGLSRARFLNSVIFGQNVPLFIDLPVPARGDLLDDVLDLELWMQAAQKAGTRYSERSTDLIALQTSISRLSGHIEGLSDVESLTRLELIWKESKKSRLWDLSIRLRSEREELNTLNTPEEGIVEIDIDSRKFSYDQQRERIRIYEAEGGQLRSDRMRLEKDIKFFDDNANCPVCGQEITKEFSENHLSHLREGYELIVSKINQWREKLERANARLSVMERAWQFAVNYDADAKRVQAVLRERVRAKTRIIDDLQGQIDRIREEINPYTHQRILVAESKARLEASLHEKKEQEKLKISELASLNYWRQGFRKVRLFCLENVLQELTVETRNSLLALGLVNWKISFKTATETRSGTVKLGVQVNVEPPSHGLSKFEMLSGGEGQRARLAGSLGLASLVQRWAGVRYNFEVWDEPTAWLSSEGVENLLDCLSYRADSQQKSVFVCDHRALQHSSFSETYSVIKDFSGSRWEKV